MRPNGCDCKLERAGRKYHEISDGQGIGWVYRDLAAFGALKPAGSFGLVWLNMAARIGRFQNLAGVTLAVTFRLVLRVRRGRSNRVFEQPSLTRGQRECLGFFCQLHRETQVPTRPCRRKSPNLKPHRSAANPEPTTQPPRKPLAILQFHGRIRAQGQLPLSSHPQELLLWSPSCAILTWPVNAFLEHPTWKPTKPFQLPHALAGTSSRRTASDMKTIPTCHGLADPQDSAGTGCTTLSQHSCNRPFP